MDASLVLFRAVVPHVRVAAEYRASAWCLSYVLLVLLLVAVCGMFTQKLGAAPPPDALSSMCYSPLLALVCGMLARELSLTPPPDASSFILLLLLLVALWIWIARSVTRFSDSCLNASLRRGRHWKAFTPEYCAGKR